MTSRSDRKAPRKARIRPARMEATDFDAHCLEILDGVAADGRELVITKRGKPIARLSALVSIDRPLEGLLQGRIKILGDVVRFNAASDWDAAT